MGIKLCKRPKNWRNRESFYPQNFPPWKYNFAFVSGECKPFSQFVQLGPGAGKKCIFPFNHNGKICVGPKCCNLDNDSAGSWCSTKVDEKGNHIKGNYAYCISSPCDPEAGNHFTAVFYILPTKMHNFGTSFHAF